MLPIRRHRHAPRGFTFLEIMFVVVIIGILLALVGPRLIGRTNEARVTATSAQLKNLAAGIQNFELDMGSFPKSLDELVEDPGDNKSWKGPYLAQDEIPKDPWDQEYNYKAPGDKNKKSFDLWSNGPDKQENTEDDITNWSSKKN